MIAYIDSSVILRVVLEAPGRLPEWNLMTTGVISRLAETECMGAIDRLRVSGDLTVESSALRREIVYRVLDRLDVVELTAAILRRAGQPMVAPLKTLSRPLAKAQATANQRLRDFPGSSEDRVCRSTLAQLDLSPGVPFARLRS